MNALKVRWSDKASITEVVSKVLMFIDVLVFQ